MTNDPVADFSRGAISAEVALARLLLKGGDPALPVADVQPLRNLLERHAVTVGRVKKMLAGVDHARPADIRQIARMFDQAVAQSPEASVALYSLGDEATLARATAELVHWLEAERLIDSASDVLDLGCGIGRVTRALGPRCRTVLGIDISPAMIAAARSQPAPGNVSFAVTGGEGLDGLKEGLRRFDLILAVDVMPYLVQAGVAERHVCDAAHLLRGGGVLAVLNLSYRGIEEDRATASAWAAAHGFCLMIDGARPFSLWDGAAFVFRL